ARLQGQNEIERFLRDTCASMATAARMLVSVGTKDFYYHAVELYGRPASLSADRHTTNLDLAQHFDQVVTGFALPLEPVDQPVITAEEIKIKRGALFSARDLRQIEFHEGHVHMATALNGRAQPVMPFVGSPSPRTTSSQEGLAVLTEFLTRSTS